MTPAAFSIFVFGGYIIVLCAGLLVVPNVLLGLIGLPPTQEPYLRLVGLIGGVLGAYYLVAAKHNWVPFFRATIGGRLTVMVGLMVMVGLELAPPVLLVGGGIELLGAGWTAIALWRMNEPPPTVSAG